MYTHLLLVRGRQRGMFVAESSEAIYLFTKDTKMKRGLHTQSRGENRHVPSNRNYWAHVSTLYPMIINSSIILILIDEETEAEGFVNLPKVTKMVSEEAGRNLDVRQPWWHLIERVFSANRVSDTLTSKVAFWGGRGKHRVSRLEEAFEDIWTNLPPGLKVPVQMSLQVRKACFLLSARSISCRAIEPGDYTYMKKKKQNGKTLAKTILRISKSI